TLLHEVMRDMFRKRREKQPEAESAFKSVETLETAMGRELEAAIRKHPIDASPHRKRMMERALKDTLHEFAVREIRYAELFGATPTFFELSFGQEPEANVDDDELTQDEPRSYDPASTQKP